MTLAEDNTGTAIPCEETQRAAEVAIAVVDTTELRWFADGLLPAFFEAEHQGVRYT